MAQKPLESDRQAAVTERLKEWIRQEVARGIPMENILIACEECGLLEMVDHDDDDEIPEVTD